MSLKVGDKVRIVSPCHNFSYYDVGSEAVVVDCADSEVVQVNFTKGWNGDVYDTEFCVYIEEFEVINEKEKIVKKQKSVSEFKVAAYAVVNTETGEVLGIADKRSEAREELQALKNHPRDNIKIIKLQPQKFIR